MKCFFHKRLGTTLIEIIVAGALLAMLSVTVSGLLLSMFCTSKTGQARHEISLEAKKLREHLKAYVTADTSLTLNAPGNPPWHLPADSSCTNCWALANGQHNASDLLSADLREKYKATMTYRVTGEPFHGRTVKKVDIAIDWEMP